MTHEEIVKALRCVSCREKCPVVNCDEGCPYWLDDDKFSIDGLDAEITTKEELCRAAADMLEQDARGWISVKDRLPENDDEVAIASGSYMTTGYYDGEWHGMLSYVTHWMPLPEPPREETK